MNAAVSMGISAFEAATRKLESDSLIATVFWNSGTEKLADWNATLILFRHEYKVPILPTEFAAHLAAVIALTTPVLLVLGLLTRPTALVLLGMTGVIEAFVYPQAWPTHIQWAAMLLVRYAAGPELGPQMHYCGGGS